MWTMIYRKARGKYKVGDVHCIGNGVYDANNFLLEYLEKYDIPDQDISHLYQGDPPELVATLDDLVQYTPEEKAQLIDRATGKAIDKAIHPLAGQEEQIGILRDQIVHILNGDMTPSPDFARLNEIAIKAVEEGAARKESL